MIRPANSGNLISYSHEAILESARQAVQEALWEHKLLGNPIARGENGIVKIIQPDDLVLDERFHPAKRARNQ
jgi:hypothetical protein